MSRAIQRTALDYVIIESINDLADSVGQKFRVDDVLHLVLQNKAVAAITKRLRDEFDKRYKLDVLFARYIKGQVRHHLQHAKDANGIRVYECYSDGHGDYRWQRLKYMTRQDLRAIIAERRVLVGRITAQIKRYEIMLSELDKYNERTIVDTVYEDATKRIKEAERKEKSA